MKKILFSIIFLTASVLHITAEPAECMSNAEYREIMATIELLNYCNTFGGSLPSQKKPWPYPDIFYNRIKRGERFEGVPVIEFSNMCNEAALRLVELTQAWQNKRSKEIKK